MRPIQIEVEQMVLADYFPDPRSFASEGYLIELNQENGKASIGFRGESGRYKVAIAYHDERDGVGRLLVRVAGRPIDEWNLDANSNSDSPEPGNSIIRTLSTDLTVNTGDEIEIVGSRDRGERTRVDYLRFIPIDYDPERFSYATAAKGVFANLERGVGLIPTYHTPLRALKIMPVGDSITEGNDGVSKGSERGGYRTELWQQFQALGLEIDFVGSQSSGPASLPDKQHEGHGGWTIPEIDGNIDRWLYDQKPDIVLLTIGTNDTKFNSGKKTAKALSRLLDRIADHPNFTGELLVASIPPKKFPQDRSSIKNTDSYNERIPETIANQSADGQISFVDIRRRLTEKDLAPPPDKGLHLNAIGYAKMAQGWYEAILDRIGERDDLSGVNWITGSAFDDRLIGNGVANSIGGGKGSDRLTGGGGADTFVYNTIAEGGDWITDFDPAQGDRIQIVAAGFGGGLQPGTTLANGIPSATGTFVTGTTAIGTGVNVLYDPNTGLLSVDPDGTGSIPSMPLVAIENRPLLEVRAIELV
jgi:serralysin